MPEDAANAAAHSMTVKIAAIAAATKVIKTRPFIEVTERIASGRLGSHTVFTGVGKSGMVARRLSATFASCGIPSYFLHAGDALHGDMGSVRRHDTLVYISHSGRTLELIELNRRVQVHHTVSITQDRFTTLATKVQYPLLYPFEMEGDPFGCVPMASLAVQGAIGDALLAAVLTERGSDVNCFRDNHPGGAIGAATL